MYKFLLLSIFSFLLCIGDNAFGQGRRGNVGIPGTNRPKAIKQKKPKIKYKFHEGVVLTKTGLIIEGKFKYTEPKNKVPEYIFVEKDQPSTKKKLALSMIQKMTLAGAEKVVNRKDSTEFVWIDNHKDLYRKIIKGTIEVFDNSRVVNEKYDYITDYILLAGRQDYGYKVIRKLADVAPLMDDRPYFIKSARATGRLNTKDLRVVIFLIDMFNDSKAINRLAWWQDMEIVFRDGRKLNGKGYIQPLDMRDEYTYSDNAYVHFFNGKDFEILTHRQVKSLKIKDITYKVGMYTTANKYFFGKNWRYDGKEYLISQKIMTNNNYYFRLPNQERDGTNLIVLQKSGQRNDYIKPMNEIEIRKGYLDSIRNNAGTSAATANDN